MQSCSADFARAVSRLPTGQIFDLWKTFLYHVTKEREKIEQEKNVLLLVDQLLSVFLRNAVVSEHTMAKPAADKTRDLILQTYREAFIERDLKRSLPKTRGGLGELAKLFAHYRKCEDLDKVSAECRSEQEEDGQIEVDGTLSKFAKALSQMNR